MTSKIVKNIMDDLIARHRGKPAAPAAHEATNPGVTDLIDDPGVDGHGANPS